MALITTYVDPTDLGSLNLGTQTEPYLSLAEWNTNEATDLVAAGDTHDVYCLGGADTIGAATLIDMTGWTTGISNYVRIIGQGHTTGKLDTSKYYLDKTASSSGPANILLPSAYTQILDVQFKFRNNTGSSAHRACLSISGTEYGIKVRRCIFDIGGTSAIVAAYGAFITGGVAATTGNFIVSDSIFIDSNTFGYYVINATVGSVADRVKFYNNTFINTNGGTKTAIIGNKSFKVVNNIFQGWTTDTATALETGTDYNLTDAVSFPSGANNVVSTTLTFAGSGSYKLHSTDTAAIGAGIGPSSDSQVQTTDFEGTARAGATCDIGADQTAATPSITSTSDDTPTSGTTLTINGTDFGSQTGSANVTVSGVSMVESSWGASAIQIPLVIGDNKYNANAPIVVTNSSGGVSNTWNVQIQPASGVSYVNTSGTLASSGDRIETSPALASGDQIEISNVIGGSIGDVTVAVDGSFSVTSGVTAFDARVNDGTGWGTAATQTVGSAGARMALVRDLVSDLVYDLAQNPTG
jgi:hypothetical protein